MQCPHCRSNADIRTSKELTATYREIRYRCQNDDCGCVFVASLEATRIVVPSARPNPEIRLPFLFRGKLLTPANDGASICRRPPTMTP